MVGDDDVEVQPIPDEDIDLNFDRLLDDFPARAAVILRCWARSTSRRRSGQVIGRQKMMVHRVGGNERRLDAIDLHRKVGKVTCLMEEEAFLLAVNPTSGVGDQHGITAVRDQIGRTN